MGAHKNVPKNEEKKKIVAIWYFQLKNELPCVIFKRTYYAAKMKWLKKCKTIQINKIFLVLSQEDHTPNLKRCQQIYSGCDTVFGIVSKCMYYTKTAISDMICWLSPYRWHSYIKQSFPFFPFTLTWWNRNYILYVEPTFILISK